MEGRPLPELPWETVSHSRAIWRKDAWRRVCARRAKNAPAGALLPFYNRGRPPTLWLFSAAFVLFRCAAPALRRFMFWFTIQALRLHAFRSKTASGTTQMSARGIFPGGCAARMRRPGKEQSGGARCLNGLKPGNVYASVSHTDKSRLWEPRQPIWQRFQQALYGNSPPDGRAVFVRIVRAQGWA